MLFTGRLLLSFGKLVWAFSATIINRYKPLFLAISLVLLITFALLYQSLPPLVLLSPLPSSYEETVEGSFSDRQLQTLLTQWETILSLQPNSERVASQVGVLRSYAESKW